MVNYVYLSVYFYSVPNLRFREFSLPWHQTPIKDLLSFQNGINGAPEQYGKGIKYISVGDILNNDYITYDKIVGSIDISQETLKNYSVTYGDILFQRSSEIKDDIGRTNVYLDKDNTATFGGFVIRGKKIGDYNPSFFSFLLKSPSSRKSIVRLGAGAQHYNIGQENIKTLSFYFPNEIEQVKIANLLSKIDKRIQTQIKIIDDYNSLKMGIYNWMFKENCADYKLKQLANIVKGDQINNNQLLSNGSYYMMNGGTLPSGYLDSYNVSENTISISEGGNSCGYVQFNKERFWSGGHCYTIQNVNPLIVENKYLYHYLKHKEKEIMNLRIGTGLPNIQKKDLENFTIFVPNLLIQRKNLALFEMLDEKICILNEELERLEKQKKYLLRNLFI